MTKIYGKADHNLSTHDSHIIPDGITVRIFTTVDVTCRPSQYSWMLISPAPVRQSMSGDQTLRPAAETIAASQPAAAAGRSSESAAQADGLLGCFLGF